MDLIQQYHSESETDTQRESESESEREEGVTVNKEQANIEKVKKQTQERSQINLPPPLPRIEIYLQKYQQNMSFKNFSSYCYLPWKPSISAVRTIDKLSEQVFQKFPELSNNYKFVHPHKDRSREVKQHISITYSYNMPVDKAERTLLSMMKKFSTVEIPQSLIHEVGGGSTPLVALMNKKRKVVRFRLKDHLTFRGAGLKIFLCADLNTDDTDQLELFQQLCTIAYDVLLKNGVKTPRNIQVPHVSVVIGYLKGTPLDNQEMRRINKELTRITSKELQEIPVDVEEIHLVRPPQKFVIPVYKQRLL